MFKLCQKTFEQIINKQDISNPDRVFNNACMFDDIPKMLHAPLRFWANMFHVKHFDVVILLLINPTKINMCLFHKSNHNKTKTVYKNCFT